MGACPAEETLGNFVAGSVSVDDKAAVLAHLDQCGSCRFIVGALAHSRSLASESTVPSDPGGSAAQPIARGTRLGRYVVLDALGSGGMGVVYAAYDPLLDRKVALKLLKQDWAHGRGAESRARLLREGQMVARLSHPHVVTVLDVGEWHARDFIAMELIDGATIRAWRQERARSWREILEALLDAGRGLAAAHAAGLVHRDFKPENVLVSRAGRVVVTDFGLARLAATMETEPEERVGTPAYMAPEQIEGAGADARSDQFSFCVTAFEALWGVRPFAGKSLAAILDDVRAGRIVRVGGDVPSAVKRILVRGLSADANARHPSMDALIAELEKQRHRRRKQLVGAAAAVTAGLIAAGFVQVSRPGRLCSGAADQWSAVWSAPRKASLQRAFVATGLPYAEDAWRGVERTVDRYRDHWVEMHTQTCEATRLRGEQSEEVLGLRMECLSDRLRAAQALMSELEHPDAALVQRAVTAATRMPELDRCADAKALRAKVAPPDAATAKKVRALADRRARVEAMNGAGRYTDALALARPLAEEARALGYRPLEAELYDILGDIEESAADYPGAEKSLRAAVLAAEAGNHTEAAVRGWAELTALYGDRVHRFAEAHAAADHGRALLERLGGDARLEATLDDNLGLTLIEEGKYDDARAVLERALALRERIGADDPDTAITLNSLGNVARKRGDGAAALKYHERALAVFEKAFGPAHPKVAQVVKNIGNAYWGKGQLVEALARYQRALAIQERALGPDHPDAASTRVNVAAVYTQQGKFDAALVEYRRVLAADEKRLGAESAELLACLNNIAVTLEAKGELAAAEATARRALAIAEKTYGPMHPEVETALVNLGDILLQRKQFEPAAAAYRRAVAVSEKTVGAEHPHTAEDLGGLGFVLLAEGRAKEAVAPLERAVRIGDKGEMEPVNLAKIRFAYARSIAAQGAAGGRARALALADQARQVLIDSGGRQGPDVKEIDDWLGAQRRRAR